MLSDLDVLGFSSAGMHVKINRLSLGPRNIYQRMQLSNIRCTLGFKLQCTITTSKIIFVIRSSQILISDDSEKSGKVVEASVRFSSAGIFIA